MQSVRAHFHDAGVFAFETRNPLWRTPKTRADREAILEHARRMIAATIAKDHRAVRWPESCKAGGHAPTGFWPIRTGRGIRGSILGCCGLIVCSCPGRCHFCGAAAAGLDDPAWPAAVHPALLHDPAAPAHIDADPGRANTGSEPEPGGDTSRTGDPDACACEADGPDVASVAGDTPRRWLPNRGCPHGVRRQCFRTWGRPVPFRSLAQALARPLVLTHDSGDHLHSWHACSTCSIR
jgi:hypothetical protein